MVLKTFWISLVHVTRLDLTPWHSTPYGLSLADYHPLETAWCFAASAIIFLVHWSAYHRFVHFIPSFCLRSTVAAALVATYLLSVLYLHPWHPYWIRELSVMLAQLFAWKVADLALLRYGKPLPYKGFWRFILFDVLVLRPTALVVPGAMPRQYPSPLPSPPAAAAAPAAAATTGGATAAAPVAAAMTGGTAAAAPAAVATPSPGGSFASLLSSAGSDGVTTIGAAATAAADGLRSPEGSQAGAGSGVGGGAGARARASSGRPSVFAIQAKAADGAAAAVHCEESSSIGGSTSPGVAGEGEERPRKGATESSKVADAALKGGKAVAAVAVKGGRLAVTATLRGSRAAVAVALRGGKAAAAAVATPATALTAAASKRRNDQATQPAATATAPAPGRSSTVLAATNAKGLAAPGSAQDKEEKGQAKAPQPVFEVTLNRGTAATAVTAAAGAAAAAATAAAGAAAAGATAAAGAAASAATAAAGAAATAAAAGATAAAGAAAAAAGAAAGVAAAAATAAAGVAAAAATAATGAATAGTAAATGAAAPDSGRGGGDGRATMRKATTHGVNRQHSGKLAAAATAVGPVGPRGRLRLAVECCRGPLVDFVWTYNACEAFNAYLMHRRADDVLEAPLVVQSWLSTCFATTLYFHLRYFFHAMEVLWVAAFTLAAGVRVERWQPLFDSPERSTSPLDFWNNRWHQAFRWWWTRLMFVPVRQGLHWVLEALAAAHGGDGGDTVNTAAGGPAAAAGAAAARMTSRSSSYASVKRSASGVEQQPKRGKKALPIIGSALGLLSSSLRFKRVPSLLVGGKLGTQPKATKQQPSDDATKRGAVQQRTPSQENGVSSAAASVDGAASLAAVEELYGSGAAAAGGAVPYGRRPSGVRPPSRSGSVGDVGGVGGGGGDGGSGGRSRSRSRRGGVAAWVLRHRRTLTLAVPTASVFLFSAIFHESLLWINFGRPTGEQAAFFLLHCALLLLQRAAEAAAPRLTAKLTSTLPAPLRAAAFMSFMGLTSVLFFRPWFRSSYHRELRVPYYGPVGWAVRVRLLGLPRDGVRLLWW